MFVNSIFRYILFSLLNLFDPWRYSARDGRRLAALRDVRPETLRLQGPLFVSAGQRLCRTRVLTGAQLRVGDQRSLHPDAVAGTRHGFDRSSAQGTYHMDIFIVVNNNYCGIAVKDYKCPYFYLTDALENL